MSVVIGNNLSVLRLKNIFFISKTDHGKVVLIVIERQQTIYA
jgi:hypothetical protein